MSHAKGFRLLSFFVLLILLVSLGTNVFAETTAPAVTNGTVAISSTDGPLGTAPETTVTPPTTAPMTTTKIPESSSMLNPDITTTPESTGDTLMDDLKENGFRFTGLLIALAIAAAVIILVVLLVPKNKNKR